MRKRGFNRKGRRGGKDFYGRGEGMRELKEVRGVRGLRGMR
jgi:hypothetical protein